MSSQYERKLRDILEDYGWLPIRAAGSMGNGDLVAIHPESENSPIVIEVKKSGEDPFRVSRSQKTKDQYSMMVDHAQKGINTIYAIRWTFENRGSKWNKKWDVFWLDGTESITGVSERGNEAGLFRRGDGIGLDDVFRVD